MHALSECGAHAQATRAPGDLGQLAGPGTEPTGKKRHKNPPAFYGMLLCPSETIRFQTGALAWTVAGGESRLLYFRRAKNPTVFSPLLAQTRNGRGGLGSNPPRVLYSFFF